MSNAELFFEDIKQDLAATGEYSGVQNDDQVVEMSPFDPRDIKIDTKPIPLETIIRRIGKKELNLAPDFQRNAVWDITRKSRLIESLMLNIPIPIFYVAAKEDGSWDVVDGLQRLTTIKEYIVEKSFALRNLEFWKELDGKKIDDLPGMQYNQILETTFQFVVINSATPEAVKYNIFKRINTGGMRLSSQEIRHALYQGKGTILLKEFSLFQEFNEAITGSVNDSRMAAREIILRFLTFFIIGKDNYSSLGNMETFLCTGLQILNLLPEYNNEEKLKKIFAQETIPPIQIYSEDQLGEKFKLAMKRAQEIFSDNAFRLPRQEGVTRRAPINKALFEVWSCLLLDLSERDYKKLKDRNSLLDKKYKQLVKDERFMNAVSRDSWKKESVSKRYVEIKNIIDEVLHAN